MLLNLNLCLRSPKTLDLPDSKENVVIPIEWMGRPILRRQNRLFEVLDIVWMNKVYIDPNQTTCTMQVRRKGNQMSL